MIFVSLEMTSQLRIAPASMLNGMIKRSYNRRPLGNAEGLVVWGCMYRTCPDVIVLMDLRAPLSSRFYIPQARSLCPSPSLQQEPSYG